MPRPIDKELRDRVRDALPGMQEITDEPSDADIDHVVETVREFDNRLPYRTPIDGSAPACIGPDGLTAREVLERMRPNAVEIARKILSKNGCPECGNYDAFELAEAVLKMREDLANTLAEMLEWWATDTREGRSHEECDAMDDLIKRAKQLLTSPAG